MAVLFDGSNQVQMVGWSVPVAATGIISVSFWFSATDIAFGTQRLWGSGANMECRISAAGQMFNDIFENAVTTGSATTFVNNTLYHVVLTGDANTDIGLIYVNGVLDSTRVTANGTTVGTNLSLGLRTGAATSDRFRGYLEDWRSYDRVLLASEIETIYASRGRDGIVNGLTARFLLNEQAEAVVVAASSIKDYSNTGVTLGTITGSPTFRESRGLSLKRRAA